MEVNQVNKNEREPFSNTPLLEKGDKKEVKEDGEKVILIWITSTIFCLVVLIIISIVYSVQNNKLIIAHYYIYTSNKKTTLFNHLEGKEKLSSFISSIKIDGKLETLNDSTYIFEETGIHKVEIVLEKDIYSFQNFFKDCIELIMVDLSNYLDNQINDTSEMFSNCSSLEYIDLKKFNTSQVKNMSKMFSGCSSLTHLFVDSFNTSNVTDMSEMFKDCNSLKSLNLSKFETKKLVHLDQLFCGCSSLTEIDLSNFTTTDAEYDNSTSFAFEGLPDNGKIYIDKDKQNDDFYYDIPFNWSIVET